MVHSGLELEFHQAMLQIYKRAKSECGYNALRFLQLVSELGGLRAAKQLLNSPELPQGFFELAARNCSHLSMEQMVLEDRWKSLFSEAELGIARKRLESLKR